MSTQIAYQRMAAARSVRVIVSQRVACGDEWVTVAAVELDYHEHGSTCDLSPRPDQALRDAALLDRVARAIERRRRDARRRACPGEHVPLREPSRMTFADLDDLIDALASLRALDITGDAAAA